MVLNDTGVDATHPDFAPAATRLAGALTDPDGHGTHVAGTIMGGGNESYTVSASIPGSQTPTTNLWRGMASQAGLYSQQVDLWSGPFVSDFYLQTNASYVLTAMAAANPALLTNGFINNCSWGYQSTSYDLAAASYDLATRDSQPGTPGEHGMLFVVAAGNGGNASPGTITSPATAKNVVAVGAVESMRSITNTPQMQSATATNNVVASFSSAGNVGIGSESGGGRFKPDVVAPGVFTISTRATSFQDPLAQEVLAYNAFPNQSVLPGQSNVYAVTLSDTTTNVIIQVIPNELSPVPFPTNLVIYFDANDPPQTLVTATNEAGLPVVANPTAGGGFIEVYSPTNQPWPVAYDLRVFGIETNNDYATYYQVLKTNLNAALLPYYRYESGTSTAAGAVSGMLALMQEYLKNTLGLTPSPALLKALLINGARPLNPNSDLNPTPPINTEGYGQPNLSNSIPASLNPTNGTYSMKFYDQSPTNALQTGEWHNYSVNLASNAVNSPLRFTLVWTDPPGNPAAGLALVNNLDLVVTDSQSNVFVGNDFLQGDIYTEASTATNMAASDTVNNVENVFLDPTYGLSSNYTISVRATRVNVNAATLQTNIIGQDYALVISSDDTTDGLSVTDSGTVQQAPAALVTTVNNGMVLLHNRVGANEPNTNQYPGGLYPAPGYTNGNLPQWQFFLFANINYNLTNTINFTNNPITVTNGTNIVLTYTNLASQYTNAIFATFLPATLTIPESSPVNLSYPAANNPNIDLYVSTNPALFQLDPSALAEARKALGQGGSKTVLFTNVASIPNFYIGVKSETQQGADFDFFATLTTNFDNAGDLFGNQPITVSAYALPVVIPDSLDPDANEGANVLAFVPQQINVRKVMVTLGIQHQNPADLYGVLSHGGQQSVLNHYTGPPGGFTNTYDDEPDGTSSPYPIVPSDGPGTLQNFVGLEGNGQWLLNEQDNAFTQTGMVTMLTLTIYPQPPVYGASGGLDYTNSFILETNGNYYGYVDVPDDATNLVIGVLFTNYGPVGIYLTNQETPGPGDYGAIITNTGGYVGLGTNPPAMGPPLSGGRWYFDITNESGYQMFVTNFILIQESGTPNLTLTEFNTTPTPLMSDAHTISQICITNGLLSSNQQLASLQVGVCLAETNTDNLVVTSDQPARDQHAAL